MQVSMQAGIRVLIILLLGISNAMGASQKFGKEMVEAAQALMKKGVIVIDVRQEACEGYVKGANLISVDDITHKTSAVVQKLAEITKNNKAAPIAVYCKAGGRAEKAKKSLNEMGYTNVENLGGLGTHFDNQTMQKCGH